MNEIINKVAVPIKEVFSTYPWIKLALASVVGVLGGSGFITFMNKYAIYNYAVSYGGRLPVENVPYIDIAISILSFAFLAISLISALLIYGLLTYIAKALHKKFKNIPETIIKFLSGIFTSLTSVIVSVIYKYISSGGEPVSFPSESGVIILYILGAGALLGALIVWRSLIKPFALLTSVSLIALVGFKIFDAENYASFLREIQYGGGIPVTLVLKNDGKESKGFLFLTTDTTSIIWLPEAASYIETPLSNINKIKYHERESYEMPEITGSLTSIFRHLWK